MSLYERVRHLTLQIDGYDLDGLEYVMGPEFTRKTTIVTLHGAGEEGVGDISICTAGGFKLKSISSWDNSAPRIARCWPLPKSPDSALA